jgi:PAS domain S-box-containing protein
MNRDISPTNAYMIVDFIQKVLVNTDNIYALSEWLVSEIREITGAKLVLINKKHEKGYDILNINPERKKGICFHPAMKELISHSFTLKNITINEIDNKTINHFLTENTYEINLIIPLIAQNECYGSIIALGLPNNKSQIELIKTTYDNLTLLLGIVFKNASLIDNQEKIIATRTREIINKQAQLEQQNKELIISKILLEDIEQKLSAQNEEYESINEELSQTNEELLLAKVRAEENENRIKQLLNCNVLGIILSNAAGEMLFANDAFLNLTGYSRTALENGEIRWDKITPPEYAHLDKNAINELKYKEIVTPFEKEYIRKDGSRVPVFISGANFKEGKCDYAIFVLDITERKLFEKQIIEQKKLLEESEENLRFVFENTTQGIVIQNEKGEIIQANQSAADILGLTLEQVYGKTSIDPRWRSIREDGSDYLGEEHPAVISLKTGKPVYNATMGVFNPIKNSYRWLNINSVPRFKKNETKPYQVLATFEDITDLKETTLKLINAKNKAEEGDKLKTAFLQNISHEIRTPMNAIIGFARLLDNPNLIEEKRKNFTSIIINSTNQLLSIVNDILTISYLETKQEKLNLEIVCINDIIDELLTIFNLQANKKGISLIAKKQQKDKDATINTDKTKLTQVLTNLTANALKFTHQGYIEIGYNIKKNNKPIELEFYVKDTGIGINEDLQEIIFERFRQGDASINPTYGGTGLGLSISKGFVDLLGGKIWVKSQQDKGSTFFFTIPYQVDTTNKQILTPELNLKPLSILIAEDEENNYILIEELLNYSNIKIFWAKNGKEAVDCCKKNNDIDIVLMDLKMPEMDGFTAAQIIKAEKPNLPIIAQSAYTYEKDIHNFDNIFNDFIAKPIDGNTLIQKIANQLKL